MHVYTHIATVPFLSSFLLFFTYGQSPSWHIDPQVVGSYAYKVIAMLHPIIIVIVELSNYQ